MRTSVAVARFLVLSAAAAVVVALAGGGVEPAVAVGAYLAVVAGLTLLECLRWLARSVPADEAPARPLVARRPKARRDHEPVTLLELEALVDAAVVSGRAARVRLQPRLRDIARSRLSLTNGIDLDADPLAARAVLGERAWALVGPPHGAVPEPDAPGVALADIEAAAAALEAL